MGDAPHPPADPAKPWAQYLLQPHNPHPSPLSGTQDLISLFHLSPLYDTFLRPYLPANLAPNSDLAGAEEVEAAGGAVKGQVLLGKAAQLAAQGGTLKASPASPMPSTSAATTDAAKAPGAGLKITLGGIKLAGTTLAGADGADGAGGSGKKPKRPKMDKSFDYMVGDVLGRISQPHPSSHPSSSLLHLIHNPDPAPCPPIHPLDPSQLREAFTLKQGGLSGFDMSLWEGRGAEKGGGRKKKKRKQEEPAAGDTQKKQKR
ncbi:putative membrane protein [Rhodotorula toruloides ATCC 204091]|uniref:Mediator of RNA polymerase II transcription subunit 19 n=1 Tax=Rhodotorula toruloides TaxID=5286 RepID=A0A0K3CTU4_RHOTO|nr:putative membrane protein [Rhodotorula toruloides ATCC 204091]PRQ70667.1 hypothetical protein AAT19DRAFT_10824 [Rhodotorula toruloides]